MADSMTVREVARDVPARTRYLAAGLGGVGGCLLITAWASPGYLTAVTPYDQGPWPDGAGGADLTAGFVTAVVTVVALLTARWWPYQLALAGVLSVTLYSDVVGPAHTRVVTSVADAAFALALIAVLACAQGLARSRPGWAAAIAGLCIGARLFGAALTGAMWVVLPSNLRAWHLVLAAVGLAGALAAVWWLRGGDSSAVGPPLGGPAGGLTWRRTRPVLGVAVALAAGLAVSYLTTPRLADLLGVSVDSLTRHPAAETAVLGAVTLAAAAIAAALAGLWVLGGALTAATVQVAVAGPVLLAVATLVLDGPARLLGALAGVALGSLAAATRWRVAVAGAMATAAAIALFVAYGATSGHPEKLATQHRVVPALIIVVLAVAAATSAVGATAPELGRRGLLPVALGPLAALLAVSGLQTVNITYLHDGQPESSYLNPVNHLTTSAILFLVAGAAVSGFGLAQELGRRRDASSNGAMGGLGPGPRRGSAG